MAAGPEESGDSLVPGILFGLMLLVGGWFVAGKYITAASITLLRAESAVVAPVVNLLGTARQREVMGKWRRHLAEPPKKMTPSVLGTWLGVGGEWMRWPMALMCLVVAGWVYHRSPITKYSRIMDFERLLLEQQLSFPRIRPVLWLKKRVLDQDRGAYTWALSPYEWAAQHGVITPGGDVELVSKSFDADKAARAFGEQLGALFGGTDRLSYHEQLLFGAFAARAMDRRADSDALLDAAAGGFQPVNWNRGLPKMHRQWDWPANGPFEVALTDAAAQLLARYTGPFTGAAIAQRGATAPLKDKSDAAVRRVDAVLRQHAHTRPVLVALLHEARERQGMVTSSDFIWVKAIDRTLHYALNDVGRRVACVEGSGIRSHLVHEALHGATVAAQADGAVTALRTHLTESGWRHPPSFDMDEAERVAAETVAQVGAMENTNSDLNAIAGTATAESQSAEAHKAS